MHEEKPARKVPTDLCEVFLRGSHVTALDILNCHVFGPRSEFSKAFKIFGKLWHSLLRISEDPTRHLALIRQQTAFPVLVALSFGRKRRFIPKKKRKSKRRRSDTGRKHEDTRRRGEQGISFLEIISKMCDMGSAEFLPRLSGSYIHLP